MSTQRLAGLLGYAGLVPFIFFAVATWRVLPERASLPYASDAHFSLATYAALILSFMGAVHWGAAMSVDNGKARLQLGLSVLPALLGWLALLLPETLAYGVLIAGFVTLCVADALATRSKMLPGWYLPLRIRLTSIVVLCLLVAAQAPVAG